jgi:RNA polymerase sigma factor (TIGR02999 family)
MFHHHFGPTANNSSRDLMRNEIAKYPTETQVFFAGWQWARLPGILTGNRMIAAKLTDMSEVTRILSAAASDDPHITEQLLPLVYDELRTLAARRLAQEQPGQTLQATALVHEAYVRLVVDQSGGTQAGGREWDNRGHFFAAAAEAMRRILVERARHKKSLKAGGDRKRIDLSHCDVVAVGDDDQVLALDDALGKLEKKDPRKATLVKLRFFTGLTNEQAAQMLGVSTSTADNDWAYARSWLRVEIAANFGH